MNNRAISSSFRSTPFSFDDHYHRQPLQQSNELRVGLAAGMRGVGEDSLVKPGRPSLRHWRYENVVEVFLSSTGHH